MVGLWKKKTKLQSKEMDPDYIEAMAVMRIGVREYK